MVLLYLSMLQVYANGAQCVTAHDARMVAELRLCEISGRLGENVDKMLKKGATGMTVGIGRYLLHVPTLRSECLY